jgi:hypothetical protein
MLYGMGCPVIDVSSFLPLASRRKQTQFQKSCFLLYLEIRTTDKLQKFCDSDHCPTSSRKHDGHFSWQFQARNPSDTFIRTPPHTTQTLARQRPTTAPIRYPLTGRRRGIQNPIMYVYNAVACSPNRWQYDHNYSTQLATKRPAYCYWPN